jgi:hypothetical protein
MSNILTLGLNKPYVGKEDDFQKSVCYFLNAQKLLFHHSPNGGKRNLFEAIKFKKMGVKAGFPDIAIYEPFGKYHGLMIELKVKGGEPTKHQLKWLELLEKKGYMVAICYSLDSVIELIQQLINLRKCT